jgi:hypothetical protein
MWKIKCFVIPVIIGATCVVIKGLEKYLEAIPWKHSIDSLKKKSSCTEDVACSKKGTTVLKPEWWDSPPGNPPVV